MKTLQEKKNDIRLACIRANDDIVKLQFGCEVYCEQVIEDDSGNYHDMYGKFIRYTVENLEIIGREITLADILLALKEKQGVYDGYFVHSNGWIMWEKTVDGKTEVRQICLWNLLKPFSDQEEVTINFLHELLCENT